MDEIVDRLRAAGCVFAEDEAVLLREASCDDVELSRLLARREAGEPLEHVLGWVSFAGHRIAVGPGAFVPRRRSELLVDVVRPLVRSTSALVELCCGVAPVATVLQREIAALDVHAADLDPVPLAWAAANLGSAESVHRGDLFDALPATLRGRVDVVVANAPYVPTAEIALMPPEARDHEPFIALDGGPEGIDLHRRIAREARPWLSTGAIVVIETSRGQVEATRGVLEDVAMSTAVVDDPDRRAVAVVARS